MDNLLSRLESAREHVALDDASEAQSLDRQWRRLKARRRRVQVGRRLALAAVVLLAVGSLPFVLPFDEAPVAREVIPPAAPEVEEAASEANLHFADGSEVFFLTDATDVMPTEIVPEAYRLQLRAGEARFLVTPGLPRTFEVEVDEATVSVVGTRFVIRRLGPDRMRVEVEEGHVRVHAPDEDDTLLDAGEALEVPTRGEGIEAEPAPRPEPPRTRRPRVQRVSTWRVLAEEGRFEEAYSALLQEDDLNAQDVGDLLLAADAARLSGHRAEAVKFLREVTQHPDDPRTTLGAFTLGRMLLRERPHEAAEAFGLARRLDPDSSLAQDALAREVEAWNLAGRPERAQQLAMEYVRRWPDGTRVDAVRRLGGLDSR